MKGDTNAVSVRLPLAQISDILCAMSIPNEPADWPAFCCAIMRDAKGRYLLERRPAWAMAASGKLTCFGGKREPGESPEVCLRRELDEEIKHRPPSGTLERAVTLLWTGPDKVFSGRKVVSGGVLAWYYNVPAPDPGVRCVLSGHSAIWVMPNNLLSSDLSDWHRTALKAMLDGFKTTTVAK